MSPRQQDEHLAIDHLREELHQLGRRVEALEQLNHREVAQPAVSDFVLPNGSNAVSITGRAILGFAGAFLLRALAESGSVPQLLVVAIALLYVAAWLVFSRRTREQNAFAGVTYGITATLILMPLLWEATVRFNILSAPATATVLSCFLTLSYGLSWSLKSVAVTSVITIATLLTAIVLMVQTGELLPFAVALLTIGAGVEILACSGHLSIMQVPVAIAADFGIWLVIFTMTRPGGVPEHYRPVALAVSVALGAVLFAVYGVSLVWQTALLGRTITGFQIAQSAVVFLLSAGATLQLTQGRAAAPIGIFCGLACVACYLSAFIPFADSPPRAHHVFGAWGAVLGLAACLLVLPQSRLTLVWSVAAVSTTLVGARISSTLVAHGGLYLLAAGLTTGVPVSIFNAFTATGLDAPPSALWIFAVAAVCCSAACLYAASGRTLAIVSFVCGLLAAVSLGALLILAATPLLLATSTPSSLATARTLVICALAFAFGILGRRTLHRELVWISNLAIALGAVKLVVVDFRESHPAALALSLVCYGTLLILAPRLSTKSSSGLR